MNSEPQRTDERWFEERILAHAVGMLNDDDEERFLTLKENSPECRESWERYRENADELPSEGGHIPSAMIVRWERARDGLGVVEREMIVRHLERCDDCRGDLDFAGFSPGILAAAEPESPPQAVARVIEPIEDRPRSGWFSWLLGGFAGATATAVVAIMFFFALGPSLFQDGADPTGSGGVVPWVAPTQLRGDDFSRLEIAAHQTRVLLTLAVPDAIGLDEPAQVEVRAPSGAVVLRGDVSAVELGRATVIVLLELKAPVVEGVYEVLFAQAARNIAVGDLPADRFELRRASR